MTLQDFENRTLPEPSDDLKETMLRWSRAGYRIERGHPDTKRPLKKWKGTSERPLNEMYVESLFHPNSDASRLGSTILCLVVPLNMVVFDIDHKLDEGFDAEETLEGFCLEYDLEQDAERFPIGVPVVRTPSGGFHLYYTLPTGFEAKNWTATSEKFAIPGIDIRASGRGITVIPPSTRKDGRPLGQGSCRLV